MSKHRESFCYKILPELFFYKPVTIYENADLDKVVELWDNVGHKYPPCESSSGLAIEKILGGNFGGIVFKLPFDNMVPFCVSVICIMQYEEHQIMGKMTSPRYFTMENSEDGIAVIEIASNKLKTTYGQFEKYTMDRFVIDVTTIVERSGKMDCKLFYDKQGIDISKYYTGESVRRVCEWIVKSRKSNKWLNLPIPEQMRSDIAGLVMNSRLCEIAVMRNNALIRSDNVTAETEAMIECIGGYYRL